MSGSAADVAEIRRVVAEADAELAAGASTTLPKKHGGRREGAGRRPGKKAATESAIDQIKADLENSPSGSPEVSANQVPSEPATPPPPVLDLPPALLKPVVKLVPYGMLAAKTGFDGFNLTDEEADMISPLLAEVIKQYSPAIDPAKMPLYLYLGMTGITLAQKTAAFSAWKVERARAFEAANPPPAGEPAPNVYHPPVSGP